MRRLIRLFDNRSLGFKFTAAFVSVILTPMLLLAYISYRAIDAGLQKDTQEKIDIGFKTATTEYYARAEQMRYGMLQAASMEEIKTAVKQGKGKYLKRMMALWKKERPYVDIWMILDKNGKVIARLNSDIAGDTMEINDLVKEALLSGDIRLSTEILPTDLLKKEGTGFHEQFVVPVISKGLADEYKRPGGNIEGNAMAVAVVIPVSDKNHTFIGAIVTADILNNDTHIPDAIANKIPGLYTAIAMDGLMISTNVTDNNGQRAIGMLLSASSIAKLRLGKNIRGESNVLGQIHISAFDPIKDNKGKVIGSLYTGIPKTRLWLTQKENQITIGTITVFGIIIALVAAFISTYKITKPLKTLRDKANAFASGDMETKIDVEEGPTKDELRMLARAFNTMMGEVKNNAKVEKQYLKELEEKNKELSAANEKLSTAYEELEVSYEESQSQTEELDSINEELKLLNEDLDRKNRELIGANKTIKKDKEELKRAGGKLRLIYDGIKGYLLLVDKNCAVLEVNKYFIENLRLDESSVIGKKLYNIFGFNEKDHLKNCPVIKSIATKTTAEMELTTDDGKILQWRCFPLVEEGGVPSNAVVYIEDITEQKMLMQRLIQADKLSSLGELVSGVAHEVNNPLAAIMGYSELLLNEAADEKMKKRLENINEASHRCKRIIENLLTFARWHKPEKRYCDVNKIISDTVKLRTYQLKTDNIDVEFDIDTSLPKTMVDEYQLQQVLLNLINNAQHAVAEKGKERKIIISSRQEEKKLQIKVSDTGIGIPDEFAGRIFDPFFTTKEAGKGTGLGLSISYGIIKEHGGNIYAVNRRGEGADFIIELPIIENPDKWPAAEPDASIKYKISGKGRRALILDDEPAILELLKIVLSDDGFHVDTVSHGDEALKLLKDAHYDIIVSDIKIPGMGGKEFYNKLKSIKPAATRNVIFISGDSASKETQEFLKESGNLFLPKPFTIEMLKGMISKVVS